MKMCWCGNCDLKEYSEDYYKCLNCGTLVSKQDFDEHIYKVSDEYRDLYGKNYWENIMVNEARVESIDDLIELYLNGRAIYWLWTCIKYFKLGGKVAEVGCGLGQFSYLLRESGFQPIAYELSDKICKYIRNKMQVPVKCGELEHGEKVYDAVVAMDVFEHLNRPDMFLDTVNSILKEKGLLCLQLPCYDPGLSFYQMKKEKPNFEKLLVKNQHVYLYSRKSIQNILKNYGFDYICFEPAFFGDDYDMFLFASKKQIECNTGREIEAYLDSCENGLLIKAHWKLYCEKEKLEKEISVINGDRDQQRCDIEKLTEMIHKKNEEVRLMKANNEINIQNEKKLITQIKQLNCEKEELENACKERLELLKRNAKIIDDTNAQMNMYKSSAEERLKTIECLNESVKAYKLNEKEFESQFEMLKLEKNSIEIACEERLDAMNKLTKLVDEKEHQIEIYKSAADDRLREIEKLNDLLRSRE